MVYPPAQGCDSVLNHLCMSLCAGFTLTYARLDLGTGGNSPDVNQWRCYSLATLSSNLEAYIGGAAYCTRHTQLTSALANCLANRSPPTPTPPSTPPPTSPACTTVPPDMRTCELSAEQRATGQACACHYVWEDGCNAPTGVAVYCE